MTKKDLFSFIKSSVWNDSWFKEIKEDDAWDLLLLAGSVVRGDDLPESDVDLFLVLPYQAQIDYKVSPVHTYSHKGEVIEISKVSSENLLRSSNDKRNLYRWHSVEVIVSNNEDMKEALEQASCVTKSELRSLLWTNYCLFKIKTDGLKSNIEQGDKVGAFSCFGQNINLVIESILNSHEVFVTSKKKGFYLKKINPELYNYFSSLDDVSMEDFIQKNQELEKKLKLVLKDFNFSDEELRSWYKCNLHKFLDQAK